MGDSSSKEDFQVENSDEDHEEETIIRKILICGESKTGKTCLLNRSVQNHYNSIYMQTIGVDFALKVLTVEETKVHLQLVGIFAILFPLFFSF